MKIRVVYGEKCSLTITNYKKQNTMLFIGHGMKDKDTSILKLNNDVSIESEIKLNKGSEFEMIKLFKKNYKLTITPKVL